MLKKRIQKGKEIEILKVCELCLKGKICISTSSRHDNLNLIWLFMKPIEKLSLKDSSCIKLDNGLIRLREKGSVYVDNRK